MTREEAINELTEELIGINPNALGREAIERWAVALDMAIEALKDQRPHGEWIFHKYDKNYECSNCHVRFDQTQIYTEKRFENALWAKMEIYNFCPHCGADMTKRGLRAKMGLIDDAADAEPDLEYLKVGDTIYTQDDDKQGWTGREENK